MLFEIGFIILALLCPLLVLIAYRQGVKDRQSIDRGEAIQPVIPAHKRREASIEDVRLQTLLNNINAYDGTERGQTEIK